MRRVRMPSSESVVGSEGDILEVPTEPSGTALETLRWPLSRLKILLTALAACRVGSLRWNITCCMGLSIFRKQEREDGSKL